MGNSQLTIIRTAAGSPPAVGMIKELKKRKVRVIGLDCEPLSAGFGFCDKSYVIPRGNDQKFIKNILEICDIEKPRAIISGPEEELLPLAKNKIFFQEKGVIILTSDYETVKICADKIATYEFFKKINIPSPEIFASERSIKYPLILKPRFGRGGAQVFKINNNNELRFFIKKVDAPILQEFAAGQEYTVDIFSDLAGRPLSIVPRTRIQVESGISMKGRTVYDQEIMDLSKKIAQELKLIGPACVQCIKTKKGIKFIEINTRFGGGSILSLKADPTIIINLIKIIKGEKPISSKGFKRGLTMLRYYGEVYNDNNI